LTEIAADHAGSPRWQAIGALVFGACVIGFSGVLVRLTGTGPAAAGVWRLVVALPLLAAMTRRADGALGRPAPIVWLTGLFFALDLGFWHYGLKFTSVGASTVLSNLASVVVTAAAWIFLKQRPRPLFLVALAVAVAGAWLIGLGRGAGTPVPNAPLGALLSLATAFWYALYLVTVAQGRRTQTASHLMFWSGVIGAPLLLAAALLLGERILPATPAGLAACAALGLVHVGGQGSIAWAMGRLPASLASVVLLVQLVVATYVGWLLFGEALGPMQAAGAGIALAGVILAQWASRGSRPAAPAQ